MFGKDLARWRMANAIVERPRATTNGKALKLIEGKAMKTVRITIMMTQPSVIFILFILGVEGS
ncbi:MAG: hypothetical protein ACXAAO_00095 [Candidatus Thorarchaeota archaeon]